jgi:hypothetical protein
MKLNELQKMFNAMMNKRMVKKFREMYPNIRPETIPHQGKKEIERRKKKLLQQKMKS